MKKTIAFHAVKIYRYANALKANAGVDTTAIIHGHMMNVAGVEKNLARKVRTTMRRWTLALFCAVGGCEGGSFQERPGQAQACQIVWHDIYHRQDECPSIEWFARRYLFENHTGLTLPGWKIQIAASTDQKLSLSAFAHELMHEKTFRETGDVDAFHYRADWKIVDGWRPGETSYELDKEGL